MDKQTYYLNSGIRRAKLNGREHHIEANNRGIEANKRGYAMLESIQNELRETLDILWERGDDEPTSEYAPLQIPKLPLGKDNGNFEPGYFDSFTKFVKNPCENEANYN